MTSALVVNAGSTSLKVSVLDENDAVATALELDPWDGSPDHSDLTAFLAGNSSCEVVGHRVVHGGSTFTGPVVIDDSVLAKIGDLADLAPLHQPRALAAIDATRRILPAVPAVACFDTAFHAGLPAAAATYALPADWNSRFGLRRYGFHGLSHGYACRQAAALVDADLADLRIVSCHLGGGASLAAIHHGRSVDTTMGFTPLEGLVMATRSGSVDPGLLMWLLHHGKVTAEDMSVALEQAAGLAGLAALANRSGDMRDVRAAADAGNPAARLAIEVYLHRLRREIAAMAAAMNGLDVLVFTGGIGEHQPQIRAGAADGLGFLGVRLNADHNATASTDDEIGDPEAPVRVVVVTAREDIEIGHQARQTLARTS